MNDFQMTVITTFGVILIISLIVIAIILRNSGSVSPVAEQCPDFWYSSYSNSDEPVAPGECSNTEFGCCPDNKTAMTDPTGANCPGPQCYNSQKLGDSSCSTQMDFNSAEYTGTNGLCSKKTWANKCGLTWDGVTNVNMAC